MYRIIALIVGVVFIYVGFNKVIINSTPFKGNLESLEEADVSKYDYFEISDANATSDYAYYLHGKKDTDKIDQYFIGLVSTKKLAQMDSEVISLVLKYRVQESDTSLLSDNSGASQEMLDFVTASRKIKPSIFIQSDKSPNITMSGFSSKIDEFKKQTISGIKLQSFVDLEDKIEEGLKKDGIELDKALVIQEGETPANSRIEGIIGLVIGILMLLFGLTIFIKQT